MSTIDVDDLAQIIRQVDGNRDLGAGALAEAILDRLPAPQIIRTVAELEALDPDTVVVNASGDARAADEAITQHRYRTLDDVILPAVVVTPAAQVRAARKALEES